MAIDSECNDRTVVYPSDEFKENAHISTMDQYKKLYKRSIEDPEGFWSEISQEFYFKKGPTGPFLKYNFDITKGPIEVKWMEGAVTNVCYNVLDRFVEKSLGERIAYIWEGSEPNQSRTITYSELKRQVCKFSNVLKSKGIKKGDRVAVYMPVTIELVVAMLSCARIGAIHSVIFAGFSGDAIAERILDSNCKLLVTCDGVYRGKKFIPLKEMADQAVAKCEAKKHNLVSVIVYHHLKVAPSSENKKNVRKEGLQNGIVTNLVVPNGTTSPPAAAAAAAAAAILTTTTTTTTSTTTSNPTTNSSNNNSNTNGNNTNGIINNGCMNGVKNGYIPEKTVEHPPIPWNPKLDCWWHDLMLNADDQCDPVWVDAEDPLFILYTSGSTGKPKGVLHTVAGYMLYAATSFKYIFNYNGGNVFFCTADLGWITGHTVNCYGSLANGATIVLFDGTPFYPDPGRLWQIVDTHGVNTLYTAPTAVRSLMKYGDDYVKRSSRKSLKLLGTAGEPINEEAWSWYYDVVGNGRCPIVDTFWQTETGAPVISPLPGCTPMKPGSATFPFFGVVPAVVNEEGRELSGPCEGHLVFKQPWPAMMRTVDGNHKRFECTYFSRFPGYYCSGDGVRRDKDGFYWIVGRTDDLLNVSGHLLSTSEVESALAEHKAVAECAAVSIPHPVKGEGIYCFVVLKNDTPQTKDLEAEIKNQVRRRIGAIAAPEVIHIASALPKTRSGKIMRRILRKIARDDPDYGDTSTLADDAVLDELKQTRNIFVTRESAPCVA
ncbi:acetyl coenzyme A synthase [Brevipalpus obovatus]|uniref:acetyl coenzyme A synthase n=1 Tax=Brevipalpus obovatus TaxID=246614 RepID=UPI003D9E27D8